MQDSEPHWLVDKLQKQAASAMLQLHSHARQAVLLRLPDRAVHSSGASDDHETFTMQAVSVRGWTAAPANVLRALDWHSCYHAYPHRYDCILLYYPFQMWGCFGSTIVPAPYA